MLKKHSLYYTLRMRQNLLWFLLLPLLSFHLSTTPPDYMPFQWFLGLSALSLIPAYFIYKKTNHFYSLFFIYFSISTFYMMVFRNFRFLKLSGVPRPEFIATAGTEYICVVGISLFLLLVPRYYLLKIYETLPFYGLLNSLLVIFNYHFGFGRDSGSYGISGFIDSSGINSILLSFCFLKSFHSKKYWMLIFYIPAIFLSRSSMAYGVIATGFFFYFYSKRRYLACLIMGLLPIVIGLIPEGQELFHSGDRFKAYKTFMTYWLENNWALFGAGPGSYLALCQKIQLETGFDLRGTILVLWLWLHSDWLQALFEFGVIGFSLLVGAFLTTLKKVRRNPELFSMVAAFGSSAVFDYPLRYFLTSFVGFLCIAIAIRDD